MSRWSLVFMAIGFILSCGDKIGTVRSTEFPLENAMIASDSTNFRIRGIWKSIGNGYYLEVREDSILLYSYTKSYCYKEKNDYLEGLLNSQSKFELRDDTLGIYLTDYGERTKSLQTKKDFIRVDRIPNHCMSFAEMTVMENLRQMELYQETLQENYAFSQERELDWEIIFEKYQDRVLKENESLFDAMGEIATLTKDQHTKVINEKGVRKQYRVTPSALDVQWSFENQSEIANLNDYFNAFFATNKQHITDSLLNGAGTKILNDNIEWGWINDSVGYLGIFSFAGFLGRNYTRAQQIDSLRAAMTEIMKEFDSAKSLLVDVSFNFGGFDATAITIASYFTDEPIFAFTSEVMFEDRYYKEDNVIIYPAEVSFQKTVYVLMTDISRSAAESFVMMMDAIPNVTLVGTHTLGTLSGMLGKSISHFYTTFSNQRLVNSNGEYFEVRGVEPDVEITVFPREDVMQGHLKAIRRIVDMSQNRNG